MKTQFAPSERDPIKKVLEQKSSLEKIDRIKGLLSSLSYIVFILNDKRQIVFANQLLLDKLKIKDELKITGARPGEILACVHSENNTGGCGTTEACRYCKTVNVILEVQNEKLPATKEARIVVNHEGLEQQLDLEVSGSPLVYDNDQYVVISAQDITDKKRKQLLERIFFHDIINLAGSLDGIMETMDEMSCEDKVKFFNSAKRISASLLDEIMAQQELVKAENNELKTKPEAYELDTLIAERVDAMEHHNVCKGKFIQFTSNTKDSGIITDKVLFKRIITNMVKNALEASAAGETVRVTTHKSKGGYTISVHNNTVMSKEVKSQLFQRSFSTKGKDRGIGTYSMKLLGERYLKGEISFTSEADKGTVFNLKLPLKCYLVNFMLIIFGCLSFYC